MRKSKAIPSKYRTETNRSHHSNYPEACRGVVYLRLFGGKSGGGPSWVVLASDPFFATPCLSMVVAQPATIAKSPMAALTVNAETKRLPIMVYSPE